MKRVALAIVTTVAGLVLLLSFKTHSTAGLTAPTVAISPAASGSTSTAIPSSQESGTTKQAKSTLPPATSTTRASASSAKTYTGTAADTQYGPIVVRITVTSGKVTAANAVDYPSQDPRDAQINDYAIPILNSEAVAASSANIDTVSGASYTSAGYLSSLQSALDKAGL